MPRWQFNRFAYLKKALAEHTGNECLIWPYATAGPMGYGALILPGHIRGYAHRVAFSLAQGREANGLVMHTCDTPRCFNPKHLIEGTHKENMQDCLKKGRFGRNGLFGESHGRAQLTDEDVREIRATYVPRKQGLRMALAKKFGVSGQTIHRVVTGEVWSHVK